MIELHLAFIVKRVSSSVVIETCDAAYTFYAFPLQLFNFFKTCISLWCSVHFPALFNFGTNIISMNGNV